MAASLKQVLGSPIQLMARNVVGWKGCRSRYKSATHTRNLVMARAIDIDLRSVGLVFLSLSKSWVKVLRSWCLLNIYRWRAWKIVWISHCEINGYVG